MNKITVNKNLMEISMENAFALQVIMMIMKINYANSALVFGI